MGRKEPDLSNVAKRLTNKRQQCADEIRSLMECMAVRFWERRKEGVPLSPLSRARAHAPLHLTPRDNTQQRRSSD
jgi:hypothetical protein